MSQTADTFELVGAKREEIQIIAARHGARNVRVFGSWLAAGRRPASDVGFLIDLEPFMSF
jgi:predicted nucleotidyltransferase